LRVKNTCAEEFKFYECSEISIVVRYVCGCIGLRQRGPAVQRPAGDAADASCVADAGTLLSPESSESSGVGSKQSSLDNLLYIERKQPCLSIALISFHLIVFSAAENVNASCSD